MGQYRHPNVKRSKRLRWPSPPLVNRTLGLALLYRNIELPSPSPLPLFPDFLANPFRKGKPFRKGEPRGENETEELYKEVGMAVAKSLRNENRRGDANADHPNPYKYRGGSVGHRRPLLRSSR